MWKNPFRGLEQPKSYTKLRTSKEKGKFQIQTHHQNQQSYLFAEIYQCVDVEMGNPWTTTAQEATIKEPQAPSAHSP
ncbi:hypothetical protein ERO13_A08G221332v2 [Gossypium hirsutum]|uniref:Uncharacterized protein n=3 Tax=Gossypium TaxID=3633 RepID=A0A2P5XBX6_GOSBA|nr:hypothetical protein ES319_A08G234100v1 [Gossypium barbadense]KAG4189360.1 hypothetical protein ERO13_A08G221332v2 [Gossypium hirsutum]PPS00835.1 hypothetical protein GOBAR_AA19838 [Gossypium barbadense]TYI16476.1 hypothetical protein ES332_A08G257800v1 [Gossypium tomentosum]TYJ24173.1 hypothetical protein E1A91_A08G242800v1 [Gossypium mustelinum]